jgi:hypothetical protein
VLSLCSSHLGHLSKHFVHLKAVNSHPLYSTVFPILKFENKMKLSFDLSLNTEFELGAFLWLKPYFSFDYILHTS